MTRKIIRQLLAISGLKIECPNCFENFPIKNGRLFSMYDNYPPAAQRIIRERFRSAAALQDTLKERSNQLLERKKKGPVKIAISAQASTFGQISEQILPAFITFPYKQAECRILFKPIDYIVFSHLSDRGHVESIKFVDVKTGDGRLDRRQRQIRDRVVEGRIKHKVIG